jgi:heat shock protein HtpX
MNTLDDEELEGVLAHELTHIRNHDVRVLIISIVFVGIFSFMAEVGLRLLLTGGGRSRSKGKNGGVMVVVAVLAILGYVISILMRFAISRNREYMADAGGAALTKKPWALASALRKIAGHAAVETVEQESVQQLFIEHQAPKNRASFITKLFSTHPPIGERIAILEHV